jgi:N utilization substance protein B
LDERIRALAKNWEFKRIAKTDLALLRLAAYELLYRPDVPPVVAINEALELAKTFSTENSRKFLNGILDKIRIELDRPAREAVVD